MIRVKESDLHSHFKARMEQRGITREEVERTLNDGWDADDAMSGTLGRVMIFPFKKQWESTFYGEKEVSVYYKLIEGKLILLTVKARYGKDFPRREKSR